MQSARPSETKLGAPHQRLSIDSSDRVRRAVREMGQVLRAGQAQHGCRRVLLLGENTTACSEGFENDEKYDFTDGQLCSSKQYRLRRAGRDEARRQNQRLGIQALAVCARCSSIPGASTSRWGGRAPSTPPLRAMPRPAPCPLAHPHPPPSPPTQLRGALLLRHTTTACSGTGSDRLWTDAITTSLCSRPGAGCRRMRALHDERSTLEKLRPHQRQASWLHAWHACKSGLQRKMVLETDELAECTARGRTSSDAESLSVDGGVRAVRLLDLRAAGLRQQQQGVLARRGRRQRPELRWDPAVHLQYGRLQH